MTGGQATDVELWRLRVGPSDLVHIAAILRVEDLPPGYDWSARREILAGNIDRVREALWPDHAPAGRADRDDAGPRAGCEEQAP